MITINSVRSTNNQFMVAHVCPPTHTTCPQLVQTPRWALCSSVATWTLLTQVGDALTSVLPSHCHMNCGLHVCCKTVLLVLVFYTSQFLT